MKLTHRKIAIRTGLAALLATLGACSQQPLKQVDHCRLAPSNNVDRMFAQVSGKLQDSSCHYSYPEYRQQLLAAAKGSPGPDNEARFASLLRDSIDRGVISKRQGQALFSQYFDPEFYAVKAEARSNCSSLRRKEQMYAAMREELAYKREGMLEILEDEARFRQAQQHYSDLRLVFDAVEVACTQEL
ncbi:MAG: hypothetical protein ABJ308_01235 [Halieaceae bacterium]